MLYYKFVQDPQQENMCRIRMPAKGKMEGARNSPRWLPI